MDVTLREARKHFSRLGLMFVLGTLVIYAVQFAALYLTEMWKPEWLGNANISLALSVLPMYLVGMPILIFLVRTVPAETIEKRTMRWWQFLVAAVMSFGLAYAANFVGTFITTVIGYWKGSAVENAILDIATSISLLFVFLYMVICAPFMEEYVFRKLIVDRTVKYGQGAAVVMSGLMFGLFHGNVNQFVYAFVLGCFFAFLYVKTGKLKITIALHAIFNFFGGVVSTRLLELVDYEGYLEIAGNGMDIAALSEHMAEHMVGWLLFGMFGLFVLAMILASIILFIVCTVTKKFTFEQGQVVIPKGKRFRTVILNVGMVIYCALWIVIILYVLFQNEILDILTPVING